MTTTTIDLTYRTLEHAKGVTVTTTSIPEPVSSTSPTLDPVSISSHKIEPVSISSPTLTAPSAATADTSLTASGFPKTQSALVALSEGKYALTTTHRLPTLPLPLTHLLIRVSHVALNPCNWKMVDFSPAIGAVGGNDFSGTVVATGANVTRRHVGDAVSGFLYGLDPHAGGEGEWAGAFAEYVSVEEGLVMGIKVGEGGIGLAEASCLGAGVVTAGMGLFRSLGLEEPSVESAGKDKGFVLVYGGSTATGTMAIQLARLAGYTPITTCSPTNFPLVTSFGAAAAFDYHLPSCGVAIRAFTRGKLRLALDCITDSDSARVCYAALGSRGGRYTALEPVAERLTAKRKDVVADWVMALTVFGKRVDLKGPFGREAVPGDREWAVGWYGKAEGLVGGGLVRAHPRREMAGGLGGVVRGVDELRNGRVRGEKLVYRIS